MNEQAAVLGKSSPLIGIITEPANLAAAADRPAVVIMNSGIVHRVGPGRGMVRLARDLAGRGSVVVRFDHSGIGDSPSRQDHTPWPRNTIVEAREVMDDLSRRYGSRQFILMGICSGALTSFHVAREDPRVVGAVLMNSQGTEASAEWQRFVRNREWARQYWTRSLFNADSWRRAFAGQVQYRRLLTVLGRQIRDRVAPPDDATSLTHSVWAQLQEILERGVQVMFVLAEGGHASDFFDVLMDGKTASLEATGCFHHVTLERCDHTMTLLGNQHDLLREVGTWMDRQWGSAADPSRRMTDHAC